MDPPPVQYVKTSDGYNIAYNMAGEGRTMLMMPYPFSHATFSWTVPGLCDANVSLAAKFRVVHFDSRGQGLSTRGLADAHRVEDYLLDMEAVIRALGLDRFLLFSPASWQTAVVYASKHPEQVEALILLDPLGTIEPSDGPERLAGQAAADWDNFLMMMGSAFNPAPSDTMARLSLRDRLKECMELADYLKMQRGRQSFDGRKWLSTLKVPSLVIRPQSPWTVSSAPDIAAAIPGARLQLVQELGNMLYSSGDEPSPGLIAIEDFVAQIPVSPKATPTEAPQAQVTEAPLGVGVGHLSLDSLSGRQREVLHLIGQGKATREIADQLVISVRTVERHVADIYAKTGAKNRAQAAVYAQQHGLV